MAGVDHNAHEVAARYAGRGQRLEGAVADALTAQAKLIANAMAARVAKFRSTTALSIQIEDTGPQEKTIAPGTDYAWYIEKGVKPGGKGLPRFFDPASADAVAWLQSKLRGSSRSPERGSKAFQSAELDLRDRYEGLAWHIRHFGVKAQPFVEPTAREMAGPVAAALRAAVMATLTDSPAPAGGGAMTWTGFLKENMGAAMRAATAGGASQHQAHGIALRNLGAQWKARKARQS